MELIKIKKLIVFMISILLLSSAIIINNININNKTLIYYLLISTSYFSLFIFFFITYNNNINYNNNENIKFNKKYILIFSLIASFIILLFCSECSFFYPLNLWDDSNCFFTVGKSVLSGKVLYKDLFEQKGPYLYFIHTLAALISKNSFIGVFFFEIIFATIFLFFAYKILILFTNKNVIYLMPLLLALMYSSYNFQLGDSAEEICLCFLIIPFYFSIKNIHYDKNFTYLELFITGICAGLIFLIKFSMAGFFVGFAIMPVIIYIQKKQYKEIFIAIGYILFGLIISSIPAIIYFIYTNSFSDFFEVYIYNNIFLYSEDDVVKSNFIFKFFNMIKHCIISMFYHFRKNYTIFLLLALSMIYVIKSLSKKSIINYFLMLIISILFLMGGGRNYDYYSLILDIFIIFSLIPINNILCYSKINSNKLRLLLCSIFTLVIIYFVPFHRNLRFKNKNILPQYKFANEINKINNSTILNYGSLDNGFYLSADKIPTTKYFCTLNIPIKDMFNEQKRIIKEGEVDFIISMEPLNYLNNYEIIMNEKNMRPNWENTEYYLYRLKN